MRLFHVSEEKDIQIFEPRLPSRNDLDKTIGLVSLMKLKFRHSIGLYVEWVMRNHVNIT